MAPSAGTLRRVLIRLDADELDTVVGSWLREHAFCDEEGWAIALDGKDLRGSWSDDDRLVLFSAMTHRAPGHHAVAVGQIAVPEGTTETTQVRSLLEGTDITEALVTAHAAHTCVETARYLVEDKNADYLLTIKGNRSTLHAAAIAAARGLICADPCHVRQERGHGRINRWTTWATDTDLGLPHAARLAVTRRDVADLAGQPLSKEIAPVVTSRARLTAAEISHHIRRHWGIENLTHRPRDTVWREDDQQAYLGSVRSLSRRRDDCAAIARTPRVSSAEGTAGGRVGTNADAQRTAPPGSRRESGVAKPVPLRPTAAGLRSGS